MDEKDSPVRIVAKELPGIGVERSIHCVHKWRSVWDMMLALTDDWQAIPGVGPLVSKKIMNFIHGIEE